MPFPEKYQNIKMSSKEEEICQKFAISSLTSNQKNAIDALLEGKDVFVGTKTGSGKSLIYECAPVVFGETAIVVIIAPLNSIMKEQCTRLTNLGFKAVCLSGEVNVDAVSNGYYQFIFGSPELLVGQSKWRDILKNKEFASKHKLIVIDEAHTIIQWGKEHKTQPAFREWFGYIGELRSLCMGVPLLALTATASPTQRRQIMRIVCFKELSLCIIDNPDRSNIKISVKQVKNNAKDDTLEKEFEWLMEGLRTQGSIFPRHLLFCTSIQDCSNIHFMFLKNFGHKCSLFEMYHSKTTDFVKEKIRADMNDPSGNIRVLICTDAAGMGVNFKSLNNIVHYGPPREMDTFVQQMGRAGRDGSFAHEYILFKPVHLRNAENDVVKLLKSIDLCRRKCITDAYMCKSSPTSNLHLCCDICECDCECKEAECPVSHPAKSSVDDSDSDESCKMRETSEEQIDVLRHKLVSLRCALTSEEKTLVSSDLMHGFSLTVVDQIVDNVSKLFTVEDVMDCVPIWSYTVAESVVTIIYDVFGDLNNQQELADFLASSDSD